MLRILLGGDSRTWVKNSLFRLCALDLRFFLLLAHPRLPERINFPPLGSRFTKGGIISCRVLLMGIRINAFDAIGVAMLDTWQSSAETC
jgi:hypothetical protein